MLTEPETSYDISEQEAIQAAFRQLLWPVIADGGRKRASGTKPHWTVDPGHIDALHRHLNRWDRGERRDVDSGAHPLVHAAFRCLAIAYQESR